MKKNILFAFLCMMAMNIYADNTDISNLDNVVYIEPCTAEVGTEYTLSVRMKNSVEIEGFGFDLVLPEGITVALDAYGDPIAVLSDERTNASITNVFNADFKLDGSLNIQAYSTKGRTISGYDGEVARITIQIAGNIQVGTYPILLKDIAISDANSVTYTVDLVETSIEIVTGGANQTILDERSTTAPTAATNVDVLVKRTINADEWSTICLPFAMSENQVKAAFGDDVELGDFTGYTTTMDDDENIVGITVNFADATAIAANRPYIIKVTTPVTYEDGFTVDGVDIDPDEEPMINLGTSRKPKAFIGTYVANTTVPELCLFLSGNKFWYSLGGTKMKAFRAYFDFFDLLTDVEDEYAAPIFISIGDETTRIDTPLYGNEGDDNYYSLDGRLVKTPAKGVYIKNGKKVIVK